MTRAAWRQGLGAALSGVVLLLASVLTAPAVVDIDVGGHEPGTFSGVHGAEEHYGRRIRWTDGDARMEWAGELGVAPAAVDVELAAFFGRAGEQVLVSAGTRTVRHRLSGEWDVVRVPATARSEGVSVDIRSASHVAPGDPRPLGVRLDRISIVNGSLAQVLQSLRAVDAAIVFLAGMLGWFVGPWLLPGAPHAIGARATVLASTGGVAAMGAALLAWRAWLLQPSGLRAVGGALLLGSLLAAALRRREACSRQMAAVVAAGVTATWLVIAVWAGLYFVDAPRWDIWETVPLIEKALAGTLAPADMWGAHNEHRPMTGRLVVIGTAVFAHWNHWYELAALLGSAAWLLVTLAAFVAATQSRAQRIHPATLIAIAVFVCSATQWENWLRGYHVHILMGAIAPVLALLFLSHGAPTWGRLGLAAACAIVGELSFGTGLLAWPIGALVIAMRRGDRWQARLGVWLLAGAVAIALYFPGIPPRPGRESVVAALLTPRGVVRLVAGTLVTIAMPIAYVPQAFATSLNTTQYAVVGIAGLAVLAWALLTIVRWRQDTSSECVWLFPAALAAFGLAACMLAGIGRVSMGLYAMTASRYLAYAACFWAGLLMLLGMRARDGQPWMARGAVVLLLVITVAGVVAWPAALPFMDQDALDGRRARAQLRRGAVGDAAVVLYPDPIVLERRRAVLLEHRLSVFRPGAQ